jgi:hypothetical protein
MHESAAVSVPGAHTRRLRQSPFGERLILAAKDSGYPVNRGKVHILF